MTTIKGTMYTLPLQFKTLSVTILSFKLLNSYLSMSVRVSLKFKSFYIYFVTSKFALSAEFVIFVFSRS